MKYLRLIITLIVSCCTLTVAADDYTLYGENITVDNDDNTAVVNIYMTNVETISALQFDITLPEGIDVYYGKNTDGDMAYFINKGDRAKSTQVADCNKKGDRYYRVTVTSSTNATFKETEANRVKPVATIILDMSAAADDKINNISISNVVLSHYNTETFDSEPYYPADSQFTVTVGSPFVAGDVNSDGVVDKLDIDACANVILTNATNSRADINGDSRITILDLAKLIDMLLPKK